MKKGIIFGIGGFSAFIHTCLLLFVSITLISLIVIMNEPYSEEDRDSIRFLGGFVIAILVISFIMEIAALAVAILLILGVKRDRPQLIAPWVYLTAGYTILSFIGLIKGSNGLDASFFIRILIIILNACMWYPVFKYWRDMLTTNRSNPQNVVYNTTPGTIYNPAPGNWQDGQNVGGYQPVPSGGMQVQTVGGYYPPPYGSEQQVQQSPSYAASTNYPRQVMSADVKDKEQLNV